MFTLGGNMISLIKSDQMVRCANHDRNMFILSMIETTSRGSFNHDQMKLVNLMADMRKGGECPEDPKLGLL